MLFHVGLRSAFVANVSLAAILAATAANAQATGASPPPVNLAEQGSMTAEIVVTANKRSQSLQEVAGSISALSAEQLSTRAVTNVYDLARQTPSVNISANSGTTRVTIRGVGLQVATGVAEANVAQHIDGIFQSQATMPQVAPVDLERVEVLRGPQGTLYGRNATGGTINFITRKPTKDLEIGASAGIGSFAARRVDGYVSGPIVGDVLLGRLSAYFNRDHGYYRNSFLNNRLDAQRNYGFRGALRLAASDSVTIDLTGYYQRETGSYPPQTLLRGTNPFIDILTGIGVIPASEPVIDTRPNRTTGSTNPRLAKWTWGSTLDVQVDAADWLQVRSLTGLTRHRFGPSSFDADGTNIGLVDIGNREDPRDQRSRALSQEFNFSGDAADNRLKYLVGLYYFDGKLDAAIPVFFPDPRVQAVLGAGAGPGILLQGSRQALIENTQSHAVFADVTYSVLPAVRLNLGGRYSADRKETFQNVDTTLSIGGNRITVPSCTDLRTQQKFNEFNGKARLEWDVTPDVMGYVQYQNGFKDGGLNLSQCGDTFDPEKLTSYEAGVKSTWLNGALTFNASVFHYSYKDLQVLAFRNNTDAFVDNVPKSASSGGEVEVLVRPVRGFDINATAAFLDSEIREMSSFDQENPGAGNQNLRGRPLPNSPKFTLSTGAQYTFATSFGSVIPRAEVYRSSRYNFRLFDNRIDDQRAYTMINGTLTVNVGETYRLRAYVKNVTNKHVLNQLLFSPLSGIAGEYGRPREWGVDASFRF